MVSLINYCIGRYGVQFVLARFIPEDVESRWRVRAERVYERYGLWSLLLAGMPFIGDPLTAIAGAFKINLMLFSVLVVIGRIIKLVLLLTLTDAAVNLF